MINGWQSKSLGEVCRFIDYRGKTPTKTESGLRLITAKNVKMGFLQEEPMEFVAPGSYDSWMTRGIPKIGDVLFTTEAPLANVAQLDTDQKVVFAQRIIVLQPTANNLDRTFLKYLLLSDVAQKRIHDKGTGATVKGIKASLLRTIPIEFPLLADQQRIVAILDEAFDGIATAKANAEKNLQNARELNDCYLRSVLDDPASGGREQLLGEIAEVQSGGTPLVSNKAFWGGGIPWYSSGELNNMFTVDPERSITDAGLKGSNAKVFPRGSLLIGMYDTAALKMSVLDRDGAFNQAIAGVKPNERIDTTFLLHAINSVKPFVLSLRRGVRQKNLSLTKIKEIRLKVPPLAKQKEIVAKLEGYAQQTQRLESLYQQKLAALSELKKSLLHEAFSGRL